MTRTLQVSLHVAELDPTHAPLETSRGPHVGRPTLLFGVSWPEGEVWSEACPLTDFGTKGDHIDRARSELLGLDPGLVGAWLALPALEALRLGFQAARELQSPAARHALEWALVEAVARSNGTGPAEVVQAWLNRTNQAWPGPRQVLRTSAVLDLLAPHLGVQAQKLASLGIATWKLKCGRDLSRELAAFDELARLNLPARVRLDPGCAWSLREALDFVRRAQAACQRSRLSLEFVEDPTADPGEWTELAALAPLAADEILARTAPPPPGATSFWVLKPMVHGVSHLLALAELGRAQGQKLVLSHAFDGPWALRAACELGCVLQMHEHAAGLGQHVGLDAWQPELLARATQIRGTRSPRSALGPARPDRAVLVDGGHIARAPAAHWLSARMGASQPSRACLDFPGRSITYAELGTALLGTALPRPARAEFIPIVAEPSEGAILALLAALEHGIPALLLHPSATEESCQSSIERCRRHQAELLPGDAVVVPTSGSTAEPHLVVHTQASLLAAVAASAARLGAPTPSTRWLLSLPFAHVGGLSILLRCLVGGACVVVRPLPKAPRDALRLLDEQRVTHLSVVPTQLGRWLEDPSFRFPACVELVLVGGAETPEHLRALAAERGAPVLYTYGLTEMGSQVATERPRTVGAPPSGTSVGPPLVGVDLAVGGDGCLRVGGPMLMRRYLGEEAPLEGGLFVTSDLCRQSPGGALTVLGRTDDLIISGGENVAPSAVEAILSGTPGVRELVVIGRPSALWGHEVIAAVVLDQGADRARALERLQELAQARLAPFARPKSYHLLSALPLLASGKIDRRRLGAELSALKTE